MPESKSIIIIGAGIAGLAAGIYGQMNGYHTEIFELHDLPGGLCMAWEREDYIFDGCIHYLFGAAPGAPFNQMWQELGVANRPFIHHDEMLRVIGTDGKTLIVYADPDRLAAHMKELSPTDADLIDDFTRGIEQFTRFDMTALAQIPKPLMTAQDWAALGQKMLPFALPMAKWGLLSARSFAEKFQDPFLRRAVPQMFTWPEIPTMVGLALLAYLHTGNAAFPAGASLEFARAIERRYLDLGGTIHYKSQVEKILVEDAPSPGTGRGLNRRASRAVGVRLYNDEVHYSDYVISTADGRGTIFDMLGGKFANQAIRKRYDGHMPIYSQFQVSLGVNRDLSSEPHWAFYLLDEPILIAGQEYHEIGVKHYCFDPSLAPAGKSAVVVMLRTNYAYWQRLYGRRLYDTGQSQGPDIIINFLEGIYPGIRGQIEVIDEATPLSYERYTGNWQGASTGWLLTRETMMSMIQGMEKSLPGLRNFYMAGQWVEPGGSVPVVAMSGRNAIQMICHEDGRTFTAEIA